MKVEIWSDFTCPYCYLGNRNLEIALEQTDLKEQMKIEYKTFRLHPSISNENNREDFLNQIIDKQSDMSINDVKKLLNEQAERVGISFQFDHIEMADTFNAHRLTKYAQNHGKDQALIQLIFKKYFSQNENIGKNEVLLKIAKEVGLNEEEVDSILCLNQYGKSVLLDEEIARDIGIDGVPFFIFNEQIAVAGAQPIEVFLEVLEEVKQEFGGTSEQNEPTVETCKTMYCTGSDCNE